MHYEFEEGEKEREKEREKEKESYKNIRNICNFYQNSQTDF